jgi:hypothetical protein
VAIGAAGHGTRPGFFVYVTRRRDGVGRQSRPVSSPIPLRDLTARDRTSNLPTMPLLVGTPTRARAAPAELHPAGRHCALKPPYPRHGPLLHSLQRTCKRVKQRLRDAAEPSSDTPVVMPSGMLSGLPGQAQAWMPQAHASSLNPHQSHAGGGFRKRALFSQDQRRRNYLQLCRLLVCLPEASPEQLMIQAPPSVPTGGGVCCFRPQHLPWHQLLFALKTA